MIPLLQRLIAREGKITPSSRGLYILAITQAEPGARTITILTVAVDLTKTESVEDAFA